MPRTLSEPEFNAAKEKVLASAPTGLSESEFGRWWKIRGQSMLDGALAEAEQLPAMPTGSPMGRFASNAGAMLNPVSALKGIAQAVQHPIDTGAALIDAQTQQFGKAGERFREGRYLESGAHALAGAVPILGPVAATAGEQIASGDVAGGLGAGAGLLTGAAAVGPVTRAAGRAVRPVAQAAGRKLYQSALKPTKAVLKGVRAVDGPDGARRILVDTGLAEGIPVSPRGAARAETLIDSLNTEVTSRIQAAERAGVTLDPARVEAAIREVADDFATQLNAQPELAAIETVAQNFRTNPAITRQVQQRTPADFASGLITGAPALSEPGPIPIAMAQRMKQNTYKGLRGKYGRELGGTIEAEKAGARALKEGISDAVPEVAGLNAREGSLIPLEEAIADAMRRRGNYGIFGLTPIVASIPAITHGNVWPLLASLVDRAPGVVSRGGIWLNRVGARRGRVAQRAGQVAAATSPTGRQTDREPVIAPSY